MANFGDYPGDFRLESGDWEIQSKIWSLADYLGELTALPGLGNVMKHNSYYATMAQTVIQVKTASLFFHFIFTLFYKLK